MVESRSDAVVWKKLTILTSRTALFYGRVRIHSTSTRLTITSGWRQHAGFVLLGGIGLFFLILIGETRRLVVDGGIIQIGWLACGILGVSLIALSVAKLARPSCLSFDRKSAQLNIQVSQLLRINQLSIPCDIALLQAELAQGLTYVHTMHRSQTLIRLGRSDLGGWILLSAGSYREVSHLFNAMAPFSEQLGRWI